jgi:ABC-type antimicrobial peptide transport system permease subunit
MYFFIGLFFVTVFGVPLGILVCLLHPRWRHCVRYLFSFAFSFAVCWAIMQLAPEKFLNWWWD